MGRRYAIVGFGCAGYHALEALRQSNSQGEIHVFSEAWTSPRPTPATTYYAAGRLPYEALFPFGTLEEVERKFSPVLHMDAPVAALEKDGGPSPWPPGSGWPSTPSCWPPGPSRWCPRWG